MKVLSRILLVLLVATGCYLPSDFEADFNIDSKGGFAFRYIGDITSLSLLKKIGKGEVSGDALTKNIAIYKRDLARDSSFKSVDYIENGRYKVHYEYQSNIHNSKSFTFVRSNAIFLRLMKRKDGYTELVGNRPPKRYVDELIEKGYDTKGVLRIWTDAKVLKHNAATVKKGPRALYTWSINSMRDPLPSMILLLK
jgi:hypothetical protein